MPASTQLLTDAATMITNGPTAATAANAASGTTTFAPSPYAPGGAPADYVGLLDLYKTKLKEVKLLAQELKTITDGADPNATTLANALLTLS